MSKYYDMLMQDIRFIEGAKSCMNCGICTAICPAAQFYNYDPRQIVSIVLSKDDEAIEELLKGDQIWFCGQCISCRPRCPRKNTPAYIIQALRLLSQKLGFFVDSKRGRQQLVIKRTVGHNIAQLGYCIIPESIVPDMHREQGEVWSWIYNNHTDFFPQFTDSYRTEGSGALRKVDDATMKEIEEIFAVTGAVDFYENIEKHSEKKAKEMGYDGADDNYFMDVYNGTE